MVVLYSQVAWADADRGRSVEDVRRHPPKVSKEEQRFADALERERLALGQAPTANLIAMLRRQSQGEKALSEVEGQVRDYIEGNTYSGAAWYLITELHRYFTGDETNSVWMKPDTIREALLKREAFDLLMERDADTAWAYIHERCSSHATLTDALIGDHIDRDRRWYSAGNWGSIIEGTNVVFRYVAIARLNVWCPNDQRGRIISSALDDPRHDIREAAIGSLRFLDSRTAIDCARSYVSKWSGRSSESVSDRERSDAERLLQRAKEYLARDEGVKPKTPKGSSADASTNP
jgi:hypothetical protein